jgi:hypothetical protein
MKAIITVPGAIPMTTVMGTTTATPIKLPPAPLCGRVGLSV